MDIFELKQNKIIENYTDQVKNNTEHCVHQKIDARNLQVPIMMRKNIKTIDILII